jgi:hypothetical protein
MSRQLNLVIPPRIDADMDGHLKLFNLGNQITPQTLDVNLDFSNCNFLNSNAVAYLAGMIKQIEARGGNVRIDLDCIGAKVRNYLGDNNFLAHCGFDISPRSENVIPLRQDLEQNDFDFSDYLESNWLGNGWVQCSPKLKDAITSKVIEIYSNAFEHSQSTIGTFACGQFYPADRTLKLALVDFGIGIAENVRVFKGNSNIQARNALKWAFMSGTSTKKDMIPNRGFGLDVLKSFIRENSGKIEVYSNQGYAMVNKEVETYAPFATNFQGTLVSITVRCDNRYYKLQSEA